MLSAGLIVFKQTKNTSGKKLKYHGVPEGGASRTSKGATDSPACRAALGHYFSGGWAGAESGHPSCKNCHSCLKKINNPKKKSEVVVRGQRVDINQCSTSAEVENYCHSCLKKYQKSPKRWKSVAHYKCEGWSREKRTSNLSKSGRWEV